jgi:transcriptional regulator with XRE-family HTH domain
MAPQLTEQSARMLGRAISDARQGKDMTRRDLSRRAGISHTQVGRIEAGEVASPSREVLVALARALERNPVPLFILAGHWSADKSRAELAAMFRDGAELPEEWGDWATYDLDEVRRLLRMPGVPDDELAGIAQDAFSVAETDETLWRDSDALLGAGDDPELEELIGIARYVSPPRRQLLLDYARSLRRLDDLEYLAEAETLRRESDKLLAVGTAEGDRTAFSVADLRRRGFTGFVRVRRLPKGCPDVTAESGVYAVVRSSAAAPEFLDQSVGGHFKQADPTVDLKELERQWVDGATVMYVGRGGSLRKRIDLLARYSRGEPIAHQGGRLLWQLADHDDLLVAWLPDPDPVAREVELVDEFVDAYGSLPFANLSRPRRDDQ